MIELELETFVSTITGGGLVLLLSSFVFNRLVRQVDILADKIIKLQVSQSLLAEKIARLDHIEHQVDDSRTRLVRLETVAKSANH